MSRNYQLLERLSSVSDDVLVGCEEVAELTGFAKVTIQQRRVKGFPRPLSSIHKLRWRLGDIRRWIRGQE